MLKPYTVKAKMAEVEQPWSCSLFENVKRLLKQYSKDVKRLKVMLGQSNINNNDSSPLYA